MPFNYKPLLKLLIDKGMTREELRKATGAAPSTFARIGKSENVSMELLDRICTTLDVPIEGIIQHEKSQKESSSSKY